jgi:signal transduction histidine kinase
VQEALTNVLKHAKASEVEVALEIAGDDVLLYIRDNGVGVASASTSRAKAHGLAGMRQRISVLGGTLQIDRAPGGGTEVRAQIPLRNVTEVEHDELARTGSYKAIELPKIQTG